MPAFQRILVTGANGFVGRHLVDALAARGYDVISAARSASVSASISNITAVRMPDLTDVSPDWDSLLQGVDAVVHAAGLAHGSVDDSEHDLINRRGIVPLVAASMANGVKRFLFISSLAAQTGSFAAGTVTEESFPQPVNAYGRAKLAAEEEIRDSGICYTILRPAAIYGEGARGNFALLERLSALSFPLPFGALSAPRSFLSIDNLVLAVQAVLANPSCQNQLYLVADPVPVSVSEILAKAREAKGMRPNLRPVPAAMLKRVLLMAGQRRLWERIGEPLVVNPAKLLAIGWTPHQAQVQDQR